MLAAATKINLRAKNLRTGFLLVVLLGAGMAFAQEVELIGPKNNTVQDAQTELDAIQASITEKLERAGDLRREIEDMSGDREQQNAALIAAAQRVKLAEIEVGAMEERLTELQRSEREINQRLQGSDTGIATLLGALQRISRTPPPAMIVNPNDAVSSARGAILLAELLPQLTSKAKTINEDLKKLTAIKSEVDAEAGELKANFSALFEDQLRIATLIEARKRGVDKNAELLDAEERQAEELKERASSLSQLIKVLHARLTAIEDGTSRQAPSHDTALSPDAVQVALANSARIEPAIEFAKAKGYLTKPSGGVTVIDFGASDGFGGISNGQSIVTRADAEVVAPFDGWVIYKGPYLNYGQIVVLSTGQNYSIVLAGLDKVSVDMGQFVRLGEPIGQMGSRTIGQAVATNAGVSRPTLYIEIRDEKGPIDPTGWWATEEDQTKSG